MEGVVRGPLGLYPDRSVPLLYDHAVRVLRAGGYRPRTEKAYLHWIGRFIRFWNGAHPRLLDEEHVNGFLTDLAVERNVAAATQNQALSALLFLYAKVLGQPLDRVEQPVHAQAQMEFIPSVSVFTVYDDNIFATRRNRRDDLITTVTPHLQVTSDWSRHQLQLDDRLEALDAVNDWPGAPERRHHDGRRCGLVAQPPSHVRPASQQMSLPRLSASRVPAVTGCRGRR